METTIQLVVIPVLLVFCVLYYVFACRASARRKQKANQQLTETNLIASEPDKKP